VKSAGKGFLSRFNRMCKGPEEAHGFGGTKRTVRPEHGGSKTSCQTTYTAVRSLGFIFK